MRVSSILSISAIWVGMVVGQTLVTGFLGNATVVEDNPIGKQAYATLPEKAFFTSGSLDGNINGSVTVKSSPDGIGVLYHVKFSNLPKEGGPFLYHIHFRTVPDDGNCTQTLAHLDPFQRGEVPTCDDTFPQTCQVGDLSGKYGRITSDPYENKFYDEFGSMLTGSNSSIIDRSVAVHFANKTRITCANFAVNTGYNVSAAVTTTLTGDSTASASASPTSSRLPVTAAANALNAGPLLQSFAAVPFAALLFLF